MHCILPIRTERVSHPDPIIPPSIHRYHPSLQEYPLPLVAGAILGHNLGALGCFVHERLSRPKRRIRFE